MAQDAGDIRELVKRVIALRWRMHCVRNRIEDLARVLDVVVTELEQLGCQERQLVDHLREVAPQELADLDHTPDAAEILRRAAATTPPRRKRKAVGRG